MAWWRLQLPLQEVFWTAWDWQPIPLHQMNFLVGVGYVCGIFAVSCYPYRKSMAVTGNTPLTVMCVLTFIVQLLVLFLTFL